MISLSVTTWILIGSTVAGVIGSLLGLGGGIIIIPFLTLAFGIDIRYAIGASIVSVIATSSGAAAAFVRDRITNINIGMFLGMASTTGALVGAYLGGIVSPQVLYIIFALVLGYSTYAMFKRRNVELPGEVEPHPLASKLKLEGAYFDKVLNKEIQYTSTHVYEGVSIMVGAGIVSGLLGIGSGIFKVMAMDMFMKLPMKVSTATSNFMIGVTAAASAGIYFLRGDIYPAIAAPVAIGVVLGANIGTKLMVRMKNTTLRKIFVPVLFYISLNMLWKGIHG